MATIPYSATLAYGAVRFNTAIGKTTSRTLDASLIGRAGMWAIAGIAPALPGHSSMPIRATTPNGYTKTISGSAMNGATPVVGAKVRCFDSQKGDLVAEVVTDASGAYEFPNLSPNTKYDVMCAGPDNSYNKLIFSEVVTAL